MLPMKLIRSIDGRIVETILLDRVAINKAVDQSVFQTIQADRR
jgi:hypothetical protein